jgi:hypothetical protein
MPGHDSARLFFENSYWHLTGSAMFTYNHQLCELGYFVTCSSNWKTLSGNVAGFVGKEKIQIDFSVDSVHRWRLNGKECFEVAGGIDIDFEFSPSTNLIPIRRLNLAIGQSAKIHSAWLRFPAFILKPLEQIYTRTDESIYRYEAGTFAAELRVNEEGFVTHYPNFWQIE